MIDAMTENLLPVLLLLAFGVLLWWQLRRTHRRVQCCHGTNAPWQHVGPPIHGVGASHLNDRADH